MRLKPCSEGVGAPILPLASLCGTVDTFVCMVNGPHALCELSCLEGSAAVGLEASLLFWLPSHLAFNLSAAATETCNSTTNQPITQRTTASETFDA